MRAREFISEAEVAKPDPSAIMAVMTAANLYQQEAQTDVPTLAFINRVQKVGKVEGFTYQTLIDLHTGVGTIQELIKEVNPNKVKIKPLASKSESEQSESSLEPGTSEDIVSDMAKRALKK